jgi:homoserine O-succinyltransferase
MPILTSGFAQGRKLDADDPLVIGLVNNMPNAALRRTERNFRDVLNAASQDIPIHLRLLCLPELPRSPAARLHITEFYEDVGELWGSQLDGLIVTGAEPRALDVTGELFWDGLTKLIDWAEDRTSSAIWSCLAAHAAVRYLDGVPRHKRDRKLSGVFACDVTADHMLVANAPSRWEVPHSRWNELREAELAAAGYLVLSRSAEAKADMFVKQERESLFVFLQGHPEYDSTTLFREYRRDVGRYLSGESESYPDMPTNYFDQAASAAFTSFRQRAMDERSIGLLETFPCISEEQVTGSWRDSAVVVYRNWLSYLLARRAQGIGLESHVRLADDGALAKELA